ncbi:hypothetical protein [Nonomuraea jiangxiensis]|uniref:Uncharacterized protein n=1 Tax=Nonomuraea jiangxiensis TaxID=633440 RepID=A0A1G9C0B5_9ACTN|nr:hypothetical protein [Nonomuraea jiangxiensis]SDK45088.1 hypothetical protein SAMN05421869_11629 [Nonomuraea jiangxiensis]
MAAALDYRRLRAAGQAEPFFRETGLDVGDLYRRRQGWASFRHAAGLDAAASPPDEGLGRAHLKRCPPDSVQANRCLTPAWLRS